MSFEQHGFSAVFHTVERRSKWLISVLQTLYCRMSTIPKRTALSLSDSVQVMNHDNSMRCKPGRRNKLPAKDDFIRNAHYTDIDRLESYDCRAQETHYNNRLPQYRTHIDHSYQSQPVGENMKPLRVHYVHSQSAHENAIPLLICHDWGSSFLETARVVEGLSRPVSTPPLGDINVQAFHVVCPSIPGFGFSDASPDWHFGTEDTAAVFHKLMKKLGYTRYMLHGSGW